MNDDLTLGATGNETNRWLTLADRGGVWLRDTAALLAPRVLRPRESSLHALPCDVEASAVSHDEHSRF